MGVSRTAKGSFELDWQQSMNASADDCFKDAGEFRNCGAPCHPCVSLRASQKPHQVGIMVYQGEIFISGLPRFAIVVTHIQCPVIVGRHP